MELNKKGVSMLSNQRISQSHKGLPKLSPWVQRVGDLISSNNITESFKDMQRLRRKEDELGGGLVMPKHNLPNKDRQYYFTLHHNDTSFSVNYNGTNDKEPSTVSLMKEGNESFLIKVDKNKNMNIKFNDKSEFVGRIEGRLTGKYRLKNGSVYKVNMNFKDFKNFKNIAGLKARLMESPELLAGQVSCLSDKTTVSNDENRRMQNSDCCLIISLQWGLQL